MRRALIALLVGSIALPGCALRTRSVSPDLAGGRRAVAAQQPGTPEAAATWREYAQKLQIGSKVRVTTARNRTVKGTLVAARDDGIVVKPDTRIPEPFQSIAFTEIETLELDRGLGLGRVIAISAGAAAGAVLGILLILAATLGD